MSRPIQVWPEAFAERYRQLGYWRGDTLGGMLRSTAARWPERDAVLFDEGRWSYADLDARVDRLATAFGRLGFRPGDRVLVQLPNIPEFVAVVFALFRADVLPIFVLPAHRRAEVEHFGRSAGAVGYVTVDTFGGFDYRTLARDVRPALRSLRHVIVVGDAAEFTPYAGLETTPAGPLPPVDPASVAFLQLSGGSTGFSKLIPRTHDDYLYSVRASAEICGLDETSVFMATLPIGHNFTMSSPGILGAIHTGSAVALTRSPVPEVAFPVIERYGVTITGLVPPLALIWEQAARTTSVDLSSLQVLQVGGAKLTAELAKRVRDAFSWATLQQVFGMAEGLVNYTRLDDPADTVIHTQGRPISPDDEVLVVDDEGRPVPTGRAGHLLTRGPYTIRAYYDAPQANAAAFTDDGFYRTGDVVSCDERGYLTVHGRATDMINRGGEKVSAEEIEDHLIAHPQIHDAIVVAVPDPYLGERTCAAIVARGDAPKPAALKAWIRARGLAAYKVPDQVMIVEAFPETAVGKTSRREIRAALRSQLAATPDAAKS